MARSRRCYRASGLPAGRIILAIVANADPALSRTYDYDLRSWLDFDENVDSADTDL